MNPAASDLELKRFWMEMQQDMGKSGNQTIELNDWLQFHLSHFNLDVTAVGFHEKFKKMSKDIAYLSIKLLQAKKQRQRLEAQAQLPEERPQTPAEPPAEPLFRVPLQLAASRSDPEQLVPAPVRRACEWLEVHGLYCSELDYRGNGSQSRMAQMIEHFDQHHDMQIPLDEPVQNVFGLLGKFLRKMKAENGDPELLYGTDPEVIQQFERYRPEHQQSITGQGIEGAKVLLEMLPACNQATFKCISFALSAVVRAKTNERHSVDFAGKLMPRIRQLFILMIDHPDEVFHVPTPI